MLFAASFDYSQNLVVSSGGDARASGGSASYSVGQVSYQSTPGSNYSGSEGVQHAYEISDVSSKAETNNSAMQFTVYPNPTEDVVYVDVDGKPEGLTYQVLSAGGQLLSDGRMISGSTIIPMKDFAAGIYFINVSGNNKSLKTFKIIKH